MRITSMTRINEHEHLKESIVVIIVDLRRSILIVWSPDVRNEEMLHDCSQERLVHSEPWCSHSADHMVECIRLIMFGVPAGVIVLVDCDCGRESKVQSDVLELLALRITERCAHVCAERRESGCHVSCL